MIRLKDCDDLACEVRRRQRQLFWLLLLSLGSCGFIIGCGLRAILYFVQATGTG